MISVVVSTYNWPNALNLNIQSLLQQTDRDFEIVVADDGSRDDTRLLVESFSQSAPVPIRHVWQEDDGFRKAKILNKAIDAAEGDYLVFLDGDCIAQPDFVARHRSLAKPRHMVTGSRILLGRDLSERLCAEGVWDHAAFLRSAPRNRIRGQLAKIMPLFFKLPDFLQHSYRDFSWRRIKGCNFACWKSDAVAIGGHDEDMTGWGHEDVEFAFRLQDIGVVRRSGTWSTEVVHLWHKQADMTNSERNRQFVLDQMKARAVA